MIKLIDLLNEDDFQSEEPSSFPNEQEVIQDYIDDLPSDGTTMPDVMEDVKDYNHAFQLRLLMKIAENGLLHLSNSNIKIKPDGVLDMFNTPSDIAMGALSNYNLNEDNPCWDGYKVGNPKTKISSKTGKRVNNCVPINEMLNEDEVDYYIDRDGNQLQVIDANYLQNPGLVMVKYDNGEPVEYKGNFEADLKSGIVKRSNSEINEAFFIGESKTIECGKCGWRWKLKDGGDNPYLCHKCDYDNSYKYNDEIDEYDVDENDLYEVKDFIRFMKEYKTFLTEASCGCVTEAEYKGRKVQLGKPMQGDIKKFKVYVKNSKGKVVKVNFGFGGKSAKGKRMNIKVNNPKRRAAYRARHHCNNPGPRTSANYWSCRKW
jgi:hypothetical protein